jgi:hypothetical protein
MKNCWASSYGQCGDKITREHIISNAILDKTISVKGFSWCKDKPIDIGKASFVSNFLCNYHNELLSPCDSEIANFVSVIERVNRTEKKILKYGFSVKKLPIRYLIDGILLEKWFVKTLINICMSRKEDAIIHFDKILPILFSTNSFDKPYGLGFAVKNDLLIINEDKIEISPFFNQLGNINELVGGKFIFRGFRMIVLLPSSTFPLESGNLNFKEDKLDFAGLQLNWHNKGIIYKTKKGRKLHETQKIIFSWDKFDNQP